MRNKYQYVSKILKGKENLSLEIISKLELALGISILNINSSSTLCVAADETEEYGLNINIKQSSDAKI